MEPSRRFRLPASAGVFACGTSKEPTGREHLERTDCIIVKQKQEAEKTRIAKEQAEAELKAVKGELRTEKLKNSAAEVGTAILDGFQLFIDLIPILQWFRQKAEEFFERLGIDIKDREQGRECG